MEFVSLQIGHSYANQQKKMEYEQAKKKLWNLQLVIRSKYKITSTNENQLVNALIFNWDLQFWRRKIVSYAARASRDVTNGTWNSHATNTQNLFNFDRESFSDEHKNHAELMIISVGFFVCVHRSSFVEMIKRHQLACST